MAGRAATLLRLRGLLRKEVLQVLRDPSSLLIAFLLPVVLLLVNGYGISLDAREMRLAVVIEAPAEDSREVLQALAASPYLAPVQTTSAAEAERLLVAGTVRGMLVLREEFLARLARPSRWPAPAQLAVNATDPNTARILEGYVQGALATWMVGRAQERRLLPRGGVTLEHRYWFNPELRSADFIVPGMVAFVMSMVGTLLTALVVSREWERGTMESMLASPARLPEMIAARLACYFALGMLGMVVSVLMAILVFAVPFRGSLAVLLLAAALFLVFALSLGLFISALARSQFVAAQVAFITTMLPALMLSGMLFDIASMPGWLQVLTHVFPARYLVSILQTLFLAGTVWTLILPNLAALAIAALIAVAATLAVTRRRLD
ncbi:ABC transport system, permease component YbhS [Rhodovastum atsumiense]|uniref:Transport permease protein n=1 Tax=Rhodovastum atsumiense TaxID=504468 RepID=A0A5M6ILG5_9PROT|nr:ABC transporter permease [Rhodovastum atsumiense]KAA5609111.1 ABC transporter permease [Rhodovastum atsumiense]CAH2603787.1 ABC transport system, permease component YbhS [Rhodovastum atsumiense]